MTDFSGRVALVTGAASGIGAAVARWLDAQGIGELVLIDCDGAGLAALELGAPARRIAGDVADPRLWDRLESEIERLDHAVLNAGIVAAAPIAQTDPSDWRRAMAVNLDGAFLGLRMALRRMSTGGSIVLTSSAVAMKPFAGTGAYGVSKAALIQLARIAAAEAAPQGIRINAIAPGRVETPIWTKTPHFEALLAEHGSREAALAALRAETAASRDFTTPEVIAAQIGFLLSPASANILGTVLVSDAGFSL
ncbi:MAG: SDR family oxidoreductase [Sphingomonadales bacterium]|nr:SDR family oxidoreductase [Sphingomonadales bacterium]